MSMSKSQNESDDDFACAREELLADLRVTQPFKAIFAAVFWAIGRLKKILEKGSGK